MTTSLTKIVEQKDATTEEQQINEISSGIFAFDNASCSLKN
jgi:bifunctional UDP-N-acetylglucosamine pyrophosphorylase/glucosamine-1-phosphate N-acetyltransferase